MDPQTTAMKLPMAIPIIVILKLFATLRTFDIYLFALLLEHYCVCVLLRVYPFVLNQLRTLSKCHSTPITLEYLDPDVCHFVGM